MEKQGRYKIPKYLHRPYQVLFFDAEDMGMLFFFFLLGFLFGGVFWIIGAVCAFVILKKKSKSPRGYIKHLFYLLGLYRFKGCPTIFEDRFYE
ncbi:MAG: hypothetical protein PWQ78_845 [Petrotoga sp.]|nr:hypothetical protein [Petrotoga sp.]